MAQMDAAGGIANENIILHARAARSVVDSLNSTAEVVDDFRALFGVECDRDVLRATPWREAFRDPQQRKAAGKEVGQKALIGFGVAGAVVLPAAVALSKNGSKPGG